MYIWPEPLSNQRFINRAENELEQSTIKSYFIEWAYATNITDHNEKKKLEQTVRKSLVANNLQS